MTTTHDPYAQVDEAIRRVTADRKVILEGIESRLTVIAQLRQGYAVKGGVLDSLLEERQRIAIACTVVHDQ